ncbi:MAG: hypothetical protein ABIH23_34550, partial [bacterium]
MDGISGNRIQRSLSGRLGLLVLALLAVIQLTGVYPIPEEQPPIHTQPPYTPFPLFSQIGVFVAWIVLLGAWFGDSRFEGWPTVLVVSCGFVLLGTFVFCSGPPMGEIWIARYGHQIPYPIRVSFLALYPLLFHPVSAGAILQVVKSFPVCLNLRWYRVIFVVAFAGICWGFRSVHISRDGFQCIEFISLDIWYEQLREPLTILLHRVAASILMPVLNFTPEQSLGMLSCILGIPTLLLFARIVRLWSKDGKHENTTPWIFAMMSGGFLLMWFGHIEVYPVLVAGICFMCALAAHCIIQGGSPIWPALAYGLLLPLHLSAVWLVPAMVYLMAVVWKREGPAKVADSVAAVFLLQILIWGGICVAYYGGSL